MGAQRIRVRPLGPGDIEAFIELIDALADYERLPRPEPDARERLAKDALSEPPRFHVLLAEVDGRAVGYAVYFFTYSTFLGRPTLYLEDIFVREEERRHGVGRLLMRRLAQEARRHGCGRMEWQVLAWNTLAIGFYARLGAEELTEWRPFRLADERLRRLAEETAEQDTGSR